jgi:hypothetical protein
MKKILLLVILGISCHYAKAGVIDTIDYWHVKRNGRIILKADVNRTDMIITITKGTVFEKDMFEIEYNALLVNQASLHIMNQSGEILKQFESVGTRGHFKFKTKQLQNLAHQNGGGKLYFHCITSADDSGSQKLFEVEVK